MSVVLCLPAHLCVSTAASRGQAPHGNASAVLDTGATLSIVARRLLKTFKKTKTVAIRVGDGRTMRSLGGVDVSICLGDESVTQHCRVLDTDAFDMVIGTDYLRRSPQVKLLSLQRPPPLGKWPFFAQKWSFFAQKWPKNAIFGPGSVFLGLAWSIQHPPTLFCRCLTKKNMCCRVRNLENG